MNTEELRWHERATGTLLILLVLTVSVLLIQGYHFAVDDGVIYIPAVVHFAYPDLLPYGRDFFLSHGRMSILAAAVGAPVRYLHLPLEWSVLLFQLLGIFLLLIGAHALGKRLFSSRRAQWGGTLLLACLLPTQVAGTALAIMDSYLTARSLSTPLTILAVAAFLAGRNGAASALLLLTAMVHPQMAVYGAALFALLWLLQRWRRAPLSSGTAALLSLPLPHGFRLGEAQEPYRAVLHSRTFFFAWEWHWWEWVGALAPLLLLYGLTRWRPAFVRPVALQLCRALILLGAISLAVFLLLSSSPQFDYLVRLQPMRSLHLVYIVFFVLLGGVVAERLLQHRVWLGVCLFGSISVGMYAVDRNIYPSSDHLELPGRASSNAWVQAFGWARDHTRPDEVFALPPQYLLLPGEDTHGFRATARRSMIADELKDAGVVSVFPQLAPEWDREVSMTRCWEHYTAADFHALPAHSPATWAIVQLPQAQGLNCPYRNQAVAVCRL